MCAPSKTRVVVVPLFTGPFIVRSQQIGVTRAAYTIRDPPTCDGRNTEVWHGNAISWIKVHELLAADHPHKYPKTVQGLILS